MKTKVSIVKCKTYNPEEVAFSVRKAFDLLGGLSSFIKKGEKVLIKPNMLSGSLPERGVNTHIEIIVSVVKLVKECGAYPAIGDNPGGSISARQAYESSGIATLTKEENIELLEVKDIKIVNGLPIASYFFEYDKIISLPKMKTHLLTTITGAIKNMYGVVAGLNKSQHHKNFPAPQEFINVLLDAFEAVKPDITLMDGVIAMEGDGPAAGDLRDVGLLMAGTDGVAVDSVFSSLIGQNPFNLLTTEKAYRRGLGEIDLNNIEILGEKIEDNFIKRFKLPRSKAYMKLPKGFIKILANFIKFAPYINGKVCKKCMVCQKTCPVSAITITENINSIDYKKCIRCMCCHEVCPDRAIGLKRNILARVFGL